MPQRLLGFAGITLALAATLLVLFTSDRLGEALAAFGMDLPLPGRLLVSASWLAWLFPSLTLGVLLALRARPPAQRLLASFVVGVLCVLVALAWVGFGALLPLSSLEPVV
jgi:hypothetical protein